jgi:hypothetical protein
MALSARFAADEIRRGGHCSPTGAYATSVEAVAQKHDGKANPDTERDHGRKYCGNPAPGRRARGLTRTGGRTCVLCASALRSSSFSSHHAAGPEQSAPLDHLRQRIGIIRSTQEISG